MKRAVFVALLVALQTSPAFAWWEYAKWGMTEQQLMAASKNAARMCEGASSEECRAPFKNMPISMYHPGLHIAGFPATAQFSFDDQRKLVATCLWFKNARFPALVDALIATYGTPASVSNQWPATRTWRDGTKGTLVKIWDFPDSHKTIIEYSPAPKGL